MVCRKYLVLNLHSRTQITMIHRIGFFLLLVSLTSSAEEMLKHQEEKGSSCLPFDRKQREK